MLGKTQITTTSAKGLSFEIKVKRVTNSMNTECDAIFSTFSDIYAEWCGNLFLLEFDLMFPLF